MARGRSRRGEQLVVVLGDNIFEHSHAAEIAAWGARAAGAQVFVKEVPDPENFGVVVYDDDGSVVDLAEKAGVVDLRYPTPPTSDAVVGLYCYPPDVFDVIAELEPSSRGELEITDVNRHYAQRGALVGRHRCDGWWEDAGKHWQHLAEIGRTIERDRGEQVTRRGDRADPAAALRGRARLVLRAAAGERAAEAHACRRTSRSRAAG